MPIQIVSQEHYQVIRELFDDVESSVRIISPFVGTNMARLLTGSMEENPNLKVEVITRFYREDFINGVSSIDALERLNDAGVKIYALDGLHTKLYLFDNDIALLGSANFTSGGFKLNHELSLFIDEEALVNQDLQTYFENLLDDIIKAGDYLLTAEKIAEEKRLITSILERRTQKGIKYKNEARFGAKIPTTHPTTDIEEADPIQVILSDSVPSEYHETIWLKFEGGSAYRLSITEKYSPCISEQFPHGVTCFSHSKKPSVAYGDYIYMAVICMDEKGHSVLPYIVGRGVSEGYGGEATPEMIAKHDWMAEFPNYCPFIEFEYLNTTISECIPLINILRDLGAETYISTMGKALSISDLSNRHHQKAHMRLTSTAKNYIDNIFDEKAKKHGVIKTHSDVARTDNTNNPQNSTDKNNESIIRAADIREYIIRKIDEKSGVLIISGEIHREIGLVNRHRNVCSVMQQLARIYKHEIVDDHTHSHETSTLAIRYYEKL